MKWFKLFFKPLLGIVIILFLVKYGGLSPTLIKQAIQDQPGFLLWGLTCYLLLSVVAGYRWYLLLTCGQNKFTFKHIFSLHMIGLFFVTLLPGGTGGDVVKGYYLYRDSDSSKGFALSSIVMDRVVGFYTLLTWGVVGILINLDLALNHPLLKWNAIFYISCFLGATLVIAGFFLPMGEKVLHWTQNKKMPFKNIIQGLSAAFVIFRNYPRLLFSAYLMTFLVHGGVLLTFYFCARSLLIDLSLVEHAFVVPLLTLINGLPITPGGIGVGEAAAGSLYGMINVSQGAEILALYHFFVLILAFLGAPFYFAYKKSVKVGLD